MCACACIHSIGFVPFYGPSSQGSSILYSLFVPNAQSSYGHGLDLFDLDFVPHWKLKIVTCHLTSSITQGVTTSLLLITKAPELSIFDSRFTIATLFFRPPRTTLPFTTSLSTVLALLSTQGGDISVLGVDNISARYAESLFGAANTLCNDSDLSARFISRNSLVGWHKECLHGVWEAALLKAGLLLCPRRQFPPPLARAAYQGYTAANQSVLEEDEEDNDDGTSPRNDCMRLEEPCFTLEFSQKGAEPGHYADGEYRIRIENVVRLAVPIGRVLIEMSHVSIDECRWVDEYPQERRRRSPQLEDDKGPEHGCIANACHCSA
ncbi:hypothetical protein EI94DRAFT_1786922 [Lactarius quietus]|nr:hypothetical protein EI94DRAFT_1786922 [Lactarius quietus]